MNNKNEFDSFSFWGAAEQKNKNNYIKSKNVFIIPNEKFKKNLDNIDKGIKHKKVDNNRFHKVKEVIETKKDEKKEKEVKKDDILNRHLKIMKKNKLI